jgi:hypothetical protein
MASNRCAIVVNIALGITEAITLAETKASRGICGPAVWYCILAFCIWRFILACIILPREIQSRSLNRDNNSDIYIKKYYIITYAISISLWIWAMICYYNTDIECQNLYNNDYTTLWKMVTMEVVIGYISMAIMALAIWMICCKLLSVHIEEERHLDIPVNNDDVLRAIRIIAEHNAREVENAEGFNAYSGVSQKVNRAAVNDESPVEVEVEGYQYNSGNRPYVPDSTA